VKAKSQKLEGAEQRLKDESLRRRINVSAILKGKKQ
jgi:hypothetical protein